MTTGKRAGLKQLVFDCQCPDRKVKNRDVCEGHAGVESVDRLIVRSSKHHLQSAIRIWLQRPYLLFSKSYRKHCPFWRLATGPRLKDMHLVFYGVTVDVSIFEKLLWSKFGGYCSTLIGRSCECESLILCSDSRTSAGDFAPLIQPGT